MVEIFFADLEMGDATDKTANTGVPDGHSISRENITVSIPWTSDSFCFATEV